MAISATNTTAPSGAKARLFGVLTLIAGAAVGWLFALLPLQQAQAGATRVSLEMKAFLLAPMLLVGGLVLLVGGGPVLRAFTGPPRIRQAHLIVWPTFALALIAGGLAYWWCGEQLHALGYRSSP